MFGLMTKQAKKSGKATMDSKLQQQLDKELANAMVQALNQGALEADDMLDANDPVRPTTRGSTNNVDLFAVDLLGSWCKP